MPYDNRRWRLVLLATTKNTMAELANAIADHLWTGALNDFQRIFVR